ncbi:zinc finger protein ZIC 5-like [Macaca nemestrina]|uniref:zinc finger protein ZIC 5-like n=1 Tax=Macaca nemestrina TaxID=9545 RepID=UPI0039B971A9
MAGSARLRPRKRPQPPAGSRAGPGGAGRGGAPQALAARGGLAITPGLAASSRERSTCPGSWGSPPPPPPPRRPAMLLPPPPPQPPPPCALWEREEAALQLGHRGCSGLSQAHAASQRLRAQSIIIISLPAGAAASRATEARKPARDTGPEGAAHPGRRPRSEPGTLLRSLAPVVGQPWRGPSLCPSKRWEPRGCSSRPSKHS